MHDWRGLVGCLAIAEIPGYLHSLGTAIRKLSVFNSGVRGKVRLLGTEPAVFGGKIGFEVSRWDNIMLAGADEESNNYKTDWGNRFHNVAIKDQNSLTSGLSLIQLHDKMLSPTVDKLTDRTSTRLR